MVEGEEGLHPLRVGLVALHRVQLRHHDAGELGATARDPDQRLGELRVDVRLLRGQPDGLVMDGVERLTDLADLVVTRGLDRIGGPLGDLLGSGAPQGSGLGQLAHHRGQACLGDATGRVAQTVQTADHDAAQTEGHDHGADQRQHHQDEFAMRPSRTAGCARPRRSRGRRRRPASPPTAAAPAGPPRP